PNPYLSEQQQVVVADDYAMKNKKMEIVTRGALVSYYLRRMGVIQDQKLLKEQPEAYQLTAHFDESLPR
ncbi:WYL domain-containing protein, partial [Vibrio sp. 10N.222.55.C6]